MSIVSPFRALRGHLGFVAVLALLALSPAALSAQTNTPSAADGFDPNVDGPVYAMATQADGKTLIAGLFNNVGGNARANIARLNVDGSLDLSFNPTANGKIMSIALQSDGKILIGGYFTSLQPNLGATTTRNRVARLNADGTVDSTFDPNLGGALGPGVEAVLLQSDGKVVLGGTFTSAQPNGAATATTRNRLARFNANGTLDTGFDPNVSGTVLTLAQQTDGNIIVGGGFTTLQPNGAATATTRNHLARLYADGSLDPVYDPNTNNGVTKVVIQPDGRVVAGGYFITVSPNGAGGATTANRLARFNPDGTLDATFIPLINGAVLSLVLQSDGSIVLGGGFTAVQATQRNFVARLSSSGNVDLAFDPSPNNTVNVLVQQSDGSILLGGSFTQLRPDRVATALTRNRVARVGPNGNLDTDFNPDTNGRVLALVVQSDGKALVGGSFTSISGVTRNYFARLNTDGSLDTAFNPNFNGQVAVITLQADGKILVGGSFTLVGTSTKLHLVRLNPDGSVDASFDPNPDSDITAIALQSDGKVLIGGNFSSLRPNGSATSTLLNRLARLNANGSPDTAFNPSPDAAVLAIKVQSDGKIVVGGQFTTFTTAARAHIARLNADGTIDTVYNPTADRQVNAIALQSDGKAIVVGAFTYLIPTNAPVVTTIVTNTDGSTTTTKTTAALRTGIARLNLDGTVDTTFNPGPNTSVRAVALQADGKVILGGVFTTLAPNVSTTTTSRNYVARVNTDGTLDASFADVGIAQRQGNQIIALALQADGKILMGGLFTTLNTGTATEVNRSQLARLNASGTVDSAYAPNAGGPTGSVINSLTVQTDGRILVGGAFANFGGTASSNLARFTTGSVPDPLFTPNADGAVNSVVLRPSGGLKGTQLNNFVWLNPDGSLRSSFSPSAAAQINGFVNAMVVQPDGKLILAGSIKDLSGATGGNIIRYNANGTIDTSFNPIPGGTVNAMALQSDGKIIIGGAFVTVGSAATARQYLARLNADGSLDSTFDPKADSSVNAIVVQPDGKILVGGAFTGFQPNGSAITQSASHLVRLNADGTVDSSLLLNPNSTVTSIALQPDGAVVIGGYFTTVLTAVNTTTTLARNHVARIKADKTTDTVFDPNVSGVVTSLALQADGKVVIGGTFGFLQANGAATIVTRNNLARVNADGSLDAGYDPNANASVLSLALQADGKVVAGGLFTTLQPGGGAVAISRNRLARLNVDGTVDGSFDPGLNGGVGALALQADGSVLVGGSFSTVEPTGSILVGGAFTNIGGVAVRNLALLNTGGSGSSSFAPNPNGAVYALAVRPDNRVLVAGTFTNIAGTARAGLAQINLDGSLDLSFNSGASASGGPAALLLQPDGKVIVGGTAIGFGGAAHGTLERLNADGSLDAAFNPSGLGAVNALALQSDGKILVGGAAPGALVRLNADGSTDSSFAPAPNGTVNALAVQADGRIIVGGAFTSIGGSSVSYLARLTSAGAADPTFNPALNAAVTAISLQSSGKVLFGGSFSSVGGLARYNLARLATNTPAVQSVEVSSDHGTVTWTRGGSSPALVSALFEQSADGRTWSALGQGTRVGSADTWALTGQSLASGSLVYVRARGVVVTSQYSSAGTVEAQKQIFTSTGPAGPATPQIQSATLANGTTGSAFYYGVQTNLSGATFSATGLPAGLSIDPVSGIISGTATQTGTFPVTLTATNSTGTATATLTLVITAPAGGASVVRFVNLSARAQVTSTDPLIAGLVIGGTTTRTVLLRAIGPGLAPYGVTNGIAHPRMQLYKSGGVLMNENTGWGGSAALSAVFNQVGAFPLTTGSTDAAMLVSLAPGSYSVVVSDTAGASGVALAEIYDTGTDASASAPRLVNLSARATANSGQTVLIGGFVVSGSAPKQVLVRGVGPALAGYGVTAFMADPVLNLYDVNGTLIAQNDNWGTPVTVTPAQPAANAAALILAASQAGGFAFGSGSADAAVLVTLPPGSYSAQVKSVTGITGTSLVEIYELP
jgi:uncharacterized delta-60 repeat protein